MVYFAARDARAAVENVSVEGEAGLIPAANGVLWERILAEDRVLRWSSIRSQKENPMRITIRKAKTLPPSLARLARRRLEFALGRFGARVHSLTVRLLDLNGPKGGIDKQCLVAVRLSSPRRLIVIEDTDVDAAVAIDRAAGRAARAVARAVQTLRDWRTATPGY